MENAPPWYPPKTCRTRGLQTLALQCEIECPVVRQNQVFLAESAKRNSVVNE